MKSFGTSLLLARSRRGLSQASVARRAGVDPSYLAAIERGRRRVPRPETVTRLADSLGLTAGERAKVEYIAAVQRMWEVHRPSWMRNRRIELALELVGLIANHDEAELRLLRGLSQTLTAEREAREEAAM